MKNLISWLQEKPYQTRLKILWTTLIAVGGLVVVIFVLNIKSTISGIDGKNLIKIDTKSSAAAETALKFAQIERIEINNNFLKIYFNFNNTTTDILNVSKLADITMTANGKQFQPQQITDRQGNAFVQKILSHTQNFGILTFPSINADKATLTFNQMFLDQNPSNLFMQTMELNFSELTKSAQIRN